jgi:hypothetical protein
VAKRLIMVAEVVMFIRPDRGYPAPVSELPADAVLPEPVRPDPALAAAAEAGPQDEPDPPQEHPYSFIDDQRSRHAMLLWAIPATLGCAALSSYLWYLELPVISKAHPSVLDNLRDGVAGFLGLMVILGLIICGVAAWPAPLYGPERRRRPTPGWLIIVRVIGYWLATFPISGMCLLLLAVSVYWGLHGAWWKLAITAVAGLAFGGMGCLLLADSGELRGEELKPGEEVSERVQKSAWWRHFKLALSLWAWFITGVAVYCGVQGGWSEFWLFLAGAFGSWLARLLAAAGVMPEELFKLPG